MSDRDVGFQSLTRAVRQGTVPWSARGFARAREVVRRARAGELKVPREALPADLLEEAALDEVALGLWLRREHGTEGPEVPAAHHLRFHAIEHFIERYADLLLDEGLAVEAEDTPASTGESRSRSAIEPSPLLLAELTTRPYDTPLTSRETPGFDPVEILKAVARRVRAADG
jgi:hypothetical protein